MEDLKHLTALVEQVLHEADIHLHLELLQVTQVTVVDTVLADHHIHQVDEEATHLADHVEVTLQVAVAAIHLVDGVVHEVVDEVSTSM
jgi:hypothetical protein